MATIKYFVPEDGDTEEHPNIFMLPKSTQSGSSPRLGDVKLAFPMPGKYHFRFKTPLIPGTDREKGAVAVWMDCVDDNQHVGVWRNSIFAKVTRISMDDDDDDDDEEEENVVGHQYASHNATNGHDHISKNMSHEPTVTRQPVTPSVPESDTLLDVFDDPTPTQRTNSAPATVSDSMNLLDHPSLTGAPRTGNGEETLLNLDSTDYTKNDSELDLLGMTATATPSQITQPVPTSTRDQPSSPNYMSQSHRQLNSQNNNGNTFQQYPSQNGPFGGLEW